MELTFEDINYLENYRYTKDYFNMQKDIEQLKLYSIYSESLQFSANNSDNEAITESLYFTEGIDDLANKAKVVGKKISDAFIYVINLFKKWIGKFINWIKSIGHKKNNSPDQTASKTKNIFLKIFNRNKVNNNPIHESLKVLYDIYIKSIDGLNLKLYHIDDEKLFADEFKAKLPPEGQGNVDNGVPYDDRVIMDNFLENLKDKIPEGKSYKKTKEDIIGYNSLVCIIANKIDVDRSILDDPYYDYVCYFNPFRLIERICKFLGPYLTLVDILSSKNDLNYSDGTTNINYMKMYDGIRDIYGIYRHNNSGDGNRFWDFFSFVIDSMSGDYGTGAIQQLSDLYDKLNKTDQNVSSDIVKKTKDFLWQKINARDIERSGSHIVLDSESSLIALINKAMTIGSKLIKIYNDWLIYCQRYSKYVMEYINNSITDANVYPPSKERFLQLVNNRDEIGVKNDVVNAIRNDPGFTDGITDYYIKILREQWPEIFEKEVRSTNEKITSDPDNWDDDYFTEITFFFGENFALSRLHHIREVGRWVVKHRK